MLSYSLNSVKDSLSSTFEILCHNSNTLTTNYLQKCSYFALNSNSNMNYITPALLLSPTQKLFTNLGSVSAASAYFLAAYGKHVIEQKNISDKSKQVYQTAKHFHFISSIALMLVPLSKFPLLTGSLFLCGLFMFSGSCYLYALCDSTHYSVLTPCGSMISVAGWLTFLI